jgi:phosphomethylpyrimidine synthase
LLQLEEAKKGRASDEVGQVAKKERVSSELVRQRVASGRVVIPKNATHRIPAMGIGQGLRVKINANVGLSETRGTVRGEVEKAKIAVEAGADTVMDLSVGKQTRKSRKAILRAVNVPVGTVPIYDSNSMTEDSVFKAIEAHLHDGIDFITVHCGVTKESVLALKKQKRLIPMVSRGGAIIAEYVMDTGNENPLYDNYDYLLELARQYDATLSLGDGMRPGCLHDATDRPQLKELEILGRLVKRARKANVQAMVEGPGHIPLNQIEENIKLEKKLCSGAPFYVLGPLVIDTGVGWDHLVGAIGGALAAMHGADFLCYVTPAEHVGLPNKEDVRQGVIASKIAAHAVDVTRGFDIHKDHAISKARANLDWSRQVEYAIDPSKFSCYALKNRVPCSMCGSYCPIKRLKKKK